MTTTDEIADCVFRFSAYVPYGPPGGITFNQFLVVDDEPALVHTGMRMHFGELLDAVKRVIDPARLRWITSNHASRPDELGALDDWFAVSPDALVVHGDVACRVNLVEVAEARRRAVTDRDVVETGRSRLRWFAAPHVPGPWEAGFWHEETTGVLFTGDVFSRPGAGPAVTTDDIVGPAIAHDTRGGATALTPTTASTLRDLAELRPAVLALMHGPAFTGDTDAAMRELADHFERRFTATVGRR